MEKNKTKWINVGPKTKWINVGPKTKWINVGPKTKWRDDEKTNKHGK